jgi:hypothetical protein
LISEKDFNTLTEKPKRFTEKVAPLKAYNNQPIQTKGACRLNVTVKGKLHNMLFIVVPDGHKSLLGDKASEDLGLVKRIYQINTDSLTVVKQGKELEHQQCEGSSNMVNEFSSVLEGHGTLPYTYKIQLKDDAVPVVHAPRRVPAPLRAGLKN